MRLFLFLAIIFIAIPQSIDAMLSTGKVFGGPTLQKKSAFASETLKTSLPSSSSNSLFFKSKEGQRFPSMEIKASQGNNEGTMEGKNGGKRTYRRKVTPEFTEFMGNIGKEIEEKGEYEEKADEQILGKFKGKEGLEYVIREADEKDLDQLYKMYFENNQRHLKPTMPKKPSKESTNEEIEKYERGKKAEEEFENGAKNRIKTELIFKRPNRRVLVVAQKMPGWELGALVAYLICQKMPNFEEKGEIIRIDDFFVPPEYWQKSFGKKLFDELIKIAKDEEIKTIEWTAHSNMEGIIGEELGELEGVKMENGEFELWHLERKNFEGHIYERGAEEKEKIVEAIKKDFFEIIQRPIYADINLMLENGKFIAEVEEMEVKTFSNIFSPKADSKPKDVGILKKKGENVGKAVFHREPHFTWAEQYAWLESLNLEVNSKQRKKATETVFGKLEEYFSKRKVQGIAWVADEEMKKKYEEIFKGLHAEPVMKVYRWKLLQQKNEEKTDDSNLLN